ncbi:erythroblast NAD(P)(+)--arginine ADP-ribosyltransferase-like isoform X1 [Seriola aureovittata]|uniref:erythroblast NAD(P)(+)--arginine ADP-ribosyltransferase-like isoform X1 n=2 Tax=Seriola TaxID=8160 RepID=UPI0024BEF8C6|nr:erythroblast NAD(P)(+)--arginine ADP-ribosyltransferase-like isoform X1 [Seriola aureovittata]
MRNGDMLLLGLLLCWTLPVDSMKIRVSLASPRVKRTASMSMATHAVDDMYSGCNGSMSRQVTDSYFERENSGAFARVWRKAEPCANKRLREKSEGDEALTKNHLRAICVYTANHEHFYKTFNDHVRSDMSKYTTSFPFHSLHFWLTSAVQILSDNMKCHTTYRRTELQFTAQVGHVVRFGFFASSSFKTSLTHFGHKTCFQIKTCAGAFLKHYSAIRLEEQEVLIPPYEMFRVTMGPPGKGLGDCDIVHILQSAGVHSNVNCKAAYASHSRASTGRAK